MINTTTLNWQQYDPKATSTLADGWYFWRQRKNTSDSFYWSAFYVWENDFWENGCAIGSPGKGEIAWFAEGAE